MVQGYIRQVEEPFSAEDIRASIKKVSPQSAPGPSGLRFSHLQEALDDDLVEELSNFAKLVFSSSTLPDLFWALHTAANLSALGGAETGAELGQSRVFCRGNLSRVSFSPIEACLNQDNFLRLLLGGFASVREPGSCVAAIIQLWDLTSLRETSHLI